MKAPLGKYMVFVPVMMLKTPVLALSIEQCSSASTTEKCGSIKNFVKNCSAMDQLDHFGEFPPCF